MVYDEKIDIARQISAAEDGVNGVPESLRILADNQLALTGSVQLSQGRGPVKAADVL